MKEYKFKINGNDYNVVINDVNDTIASVEVNGTPYKVEMEIPVKKSPSAAKSYTSVARVSGPSSAAAPKSSAPAGGVTINSPLPGVILDMKVKEGDEVKKGQTIMVLEAMKMENAIESTADGKVISLKVKQGDSVLEGAALAIIG